MRDIVFRGKRVDNGVWVYGSFLRDRDGTCYICPVVSDVTYGDNGNRRRIGCWYKVDPETVGQDTGIRIFKDDPDGDTEITFVYEGDIVKATDRFNNAVLYVVEYKDGAFMLKQKGVMYHVCFNDLPQKYYRLEVLESIHDNSLEDV